jgi:hypothetical protein
MLAPVRAGVLAALTMLAPINSVPGHTTEKSFQRGDPAEPALKLETAIKRDAGPVSKPGAQLRREVDAAPPRNDVRGGLVLLGQLAVIAPADARCSRQTLFVEPAALDFLRGTVIDTNGAADSVVVRLQ